MAARKPSPYLKPEARVHFEDSRFTPTEFYSARDKAKFVNDLIDFLLRDCPESRFTKSLYKHCSDTFHHIAHFDQSGFYAVQFSSPDARVRYVESMIKTTPRGDPAYCFVDCENALQEWAKRFAIHGLFHRRAARYTDRLERAQFEKLKAKFEPSPTGRQPEEPNMQTIVSRTPEVRSIRQAFLEGRARG